MAADNDLPDDVPEADALDQRQELVDDDVDPEATAGRRPAAVAGDSLEVPEADALDQAREVPADDEPERGAD